MLCGGACLGRGRRPRWSLLQEATRRAEYSRYQRRVFSQVGALLVHLANVDVLDRMEFAYQFALAVSGLNVWEDLESLVHLYCDRFPVRLGVTSYLSGCLTILLGRSKKCHVHTGATCRQHSR